MNSNEFRAELVKIMPGYSWTVHKPLKSRMPAHLQEAYPQVLIATGTQSKGSNRLSTLEVERRDHDGSRVTYKARSAGFGRRAAWLHMHSDGTLARALRGLQDRYEQDAAKFATHAGDLKRGRAAQAAAKGEHGNG